MIYHHLNFHILCALIVSLENNTAIQFLKHASGVQTLYWNLYMQTYAIPYNLFPTVKNNISFLIDDYSRKAWVYLLFEKSEALECFK